MTRALLGLSAGIDALIALLGELMIRAIPVVVALGAAVVLFRYAFSFGLPWLSESFVWLNGIIFMLGAPYLLQKDAHVRVDFIYGQLSARRKAAIDLAGVTLLLWPTSYALAMIVWPSVHRSLLILEGSPTTDGLPFLYVLKLCVPLFFALMSLQGLSMAARAVVVLSGGQLSPTEKVDRHD
jgi:TRAP-type mannitol/chloroaromatic compound transport system permease small subunit